MCRRLQLSHGSTPGQGRGNQRLLPNAVFAVLQIKLDARPVKIFLRGLSKGHLGLCDYSWLIISSLSTSSYDIGSGIVEGGSLDGKLSASVRSKPFSRFSCSSAVSLGHLQSPWWKPRRIVLQEPGNSHTQRFC